MKFRIMSDLHIECYMYDIPKADDDIATVLILAGDIYTYQKHKNYADFLRVVASSFRHVVLVPGNHEYYGSRIIGGDRKVKEHLLDLKNVSILDKETLIIDDFAIIGATLWADFDKNDSVLLAAQSSMNDYRYIRHGPVATPWQRKLKATDTLALHTEHKKFIFNEVKQHKADGLTTIVVSHHGPTWQSIAQQFINNTLNGAYVSDLSNNILDNPPALWIHGHVHTNLDYMCGDTRIVCNPRGYCASTRNENNSFNGLFNVEITI